MQSEVCSVQRVARSVQCSGTQCTTPLVGECVSVSMRQDGGRRENPAHRFRAR